MKIANNTYCLEPNTRFNLISFKDYGKRILLTWYPRTVPHPNLRMKDKITLNQRDPILNSTYAMYPSIPYSMGFVFVGFVLVQFVFVGFVFVQFVFVGFVFVGFKRYFGS